jgi:hypothetical protein
MKILFLKLSLIALTVLAGWLIIFGFLLPKSLLASGDSYINRWHRFYEEPSGAELVCIGSSRIHRHCDPAILSSKTHLKTEVVATAGANFYFFKELYKDYLQRNPRPKMLIVGIDLTSLDHKLFVPNPEYFYPFIKPSNAVASLDEYKFIKYCKALGYFYYKEIYFDVIQAPSKIQHQSGYLPVDRPWDSSEEHFIGHFPEGFNLDVKQEVMEDLLQFMADENRAGVTCIGIIAPEYAELWKYERNRSSVLDSLYLLAANYHVRILNFSKTGYPLCYQKNCFYNSGHLNKQGAEQFSRDLADSVLSFVH